ncbi:MAG: hypothetical protein IPP32_14460 [Bacteroidetes bacterium]|nr:hypothetical protein [Bacteroidota bacterium]
MSKIRLFILKLLICSIIQLVTILVTYGQISEDDSTILLKAFRQVTLRDQIVYTNKFTPESYFADMLKGRIEKGIITENSKDPKSKSITLTSEEQKYLLGQLKQQITWADNLFLNSKLIDADSVWTYSSQMSTNHISAVNQAILLKDTLRIIELKKHNPFVFTFLRPIYLRDKSICLITFIALCGNSCGRSEMSFYKREKNDWKKWIVVSNGQF